MSDVQARSFEAGSRDDLVSVAREIIAFLGDRRVVMLKGDLGAGKTSLVTAMCRELGSIDDATSPTFSIVNEYRTNRNAPIYHLDLYRLNTADEAIHAGAEEYIYANSWCFIEWPEILEERLAGPRAEVTITEGRKGIRKIHILKLE